MDIKISVIIPVYNVENYLNDCLDSIINQTLREIEIICINDGSTDNSLDILQQYSLEEKRISIISKKNNGLAAARNTGVEAANGQYIFFVDSDDMIEKTTLNELYTKVEKNNLDVCICDINKYWSSQKKEKWADMALGDNETIDGETYIKRLFSGDGIVSVCNKLWRRDLYIKNNIRHPEQIVYGEDGSTSPRLLIEAQRIGKINKPFYNYRVNYNGMMVNNKNMKVYQYIKAYDIAIEYLEKKNIEHFEKIKFNYKYNYAYKRLELISSFDSRLKEATEYKLLYNDFIKDIKNKENYIVKPNKWNRETIRRYLIIKSYKINNFCGGTIKTLFVWSNNILNSLRRIKK